MPHLVRANYLRQRIDFDRSLADGVISALDQLPDAIFGLNAHAKVMFANSRARRFLSMDDGLRMENGRLRLDDPVGQKKLVIELKNAMNEDALIAAHPVSLLSSERPSGDRPFVLSITRVELPESEVENRFQSAVCFLVLVSETGIHLDILPTELCQVFGLTASEGQLSLALANGMSLAEYCRSRQISMETARWHLSNVFSKTNTTRQSELVGLVSSLSVLKRQS